MRCVLFALLASLAGVATAAPTDYARQWPIEIDASAGAHAIELTPEVYASVQRADLRDLDVLDADGRAVPAGVFLPPSASTEHRRALPWFRMPAPGNTSGADWHVMAELDADGRVRVERSSTQAAPAATTLLLDATALDRRPQAIELAWRTGAGFDAGYRIEGSDDFEHWYGLGRGRLVDVREGGRALQLRRLAIDGSGKAPRYLRLLPDDATQALPDITSVDAVSTDSAAQPRWLTLQPGADGDGAYEFRLDGRYPVRWIDLDTGGNDARSWRLQSRDTPQARWVDRIAHWVVYRVGTGRSPARVLEMPVRDRYWRLLPEGDGGAPSLKLGYVPERLVFVAGGRPPYVLVAGSLRSQREPRPLQAAIDAAGPPSVARLGASGTRAGAAALAPVRDWKTWGLWAVLALGVVAVGGFALRVLREPSRPVD